MTCSLVVNLWKEWKPLEAAIRKCSTKKVVMQYPIDNNHIS